jgi:hypothetical protein
LCLPATSVIICMDQLPKRRDRATIKLASKFGRGGN